MEARAKELGLNATAWYLPSAVHIAGYVTYPDEFEQKMVGFFRAAFGMEDSAG